MSKKKNKKKQSIQESAKAKEFRDGCLGLIFLVILVSWLFKGCFGGNTTPKPKEVSTIESSSLVSDASSSNESQTTSSTESSTKVESSSKVESFAKPIVDLAKLNTQIADSLAESQGFAQNGNTGYQWSLFILEIKMNKLEGDRGVLHVTVSDDFLALSDTEKTEILNSVESSINSVTLKEGHHFITARDQRGNKVAQSEFINQREYKFQ